MHWLDVQQIAEALEDAQLRWYGQRTKVGGELFEWVYGAVDQIVWPAFPGFAALRVAMVSEPIHSGAIFTHRSAMR